MLVLLWSGGVAHCRTTRHATCTTTSHPSLWSPSVVPPLIPVYGFFVIFVLVCGHRLRLKRDRYRIEALSRFVEVNSHLVVWIPPPSHTHTDNT